MWRECSSVQILIGLIQALRTDLGSCCRLQRSVRCAAHALIRAQEVHRCHLFRCFAGCSVSRPTQPVRSEHPLPQQHSAFPAPPPVQKRSPPHRPGVEDISICANVLATSAPVGLLSTASLTAPEGIPSTQDTRRKIQTTTIRWQEHLFSSMASCSFYGAESGARRTSFLR